MQSAVKVKLMFSTVLKIEGAPTFFYALFSMTGGRGVLAITQSLRNLHDTSNVTGGFTLSASLIFPFKVGTSFSFNFHKSSIVLTLTKDFKKSNMLEQK